MNRDSVLVLDSQGPNGLALCRTLGKNGVSVTAGGYARFLPGMLSKYTDGAYVHPHPVEGQAAFVDHLAAHVEDHDYTAVLPVTDMSTRILSRNKDRLEGLGTRVGAEDWETYLLANDKGRLFPLVEDLPIPSPETHVPDSLSDVEAIEAERRSKVVIKPRLTTAEGRSGEAETNRVAGSNYVEPDEDLVARYRAIVAGNEALESTLPLVQEYIDGEGTMATVGLADDGELLVYFQHEKFRVYPPTGGIGAVRKGVWEPRMKAYAEEVVEALDWTGPIHLEFMKTHDGDFYLLEVNGRYWGSLALTINSGVDVPVYHLRLLRGEDDVVDGPVRYRTDVRQRKLFYQDLRWLNHQLSNGRWSALVPFTTSFVTTRDEFLNLDDPLPFVGLVPRSARGVYNRIKGFHTY